MCYRGPKGRDFSCLGNALAFFIFFMHLNVFHWRLLYYLLFNRKKSRLNLGSIWRGNSKLRRSINLLRHGCSKARIQRRFFYIYCKFRSPQLNLNHYHYSLSLRNWPVTSGQPITNEKGGRGTNATLERRCQEFQAGYWLHGA